MLRRLLCAVLAAVLVLSFALAEDEGGDMFRLRGYADGTLSFESIHMDPHDGPGYDYYPVEFDLPRGASVHVLTQAVDAEGNRWVLAESGKARAYLIQQDRKGRVMIDCDLSGVPEEPAELYGIWACMVYEDTPLLYGPGSDSPAAPFTATPDDQGFVVLVNGDWALVEFQGNDYSASWLPEGRRTRGWMIFSDLVY